jgi:hypothetical protein
MTPEQHDMEDLFRSAFENAALEPPHKEEMWDKIALALQKPPVPMYRTKWFRVSSIAATVALFLGAYFLNTANFPSKESLSTTGVQEQRKEKIAITDIDEKTGNQVDTNSKNLAKQEGRERETIAKKQEATNPASTTTKEETAVNLYKAKGFEIKQNQIVISQSTENKEITEKQNVVTIVAQTKEESNFALLRFEVKELAFLVPHELASPLLISQLPAFQLVTIEPTLAKEEKAKAPTHYWVGFGGFYNTHNPNFSFPCQVL